MAEMPRLMEVRVIPVEWEYEVLPMPPEKWAPHNKAARIAYDLAQLGKERWELVSARDSVMILKRPKNQREGVINVSD